MFVFKQNNHNIFHKLGDIFFKYYYFLAPILDERGYVSPHVHNNINVLNLLYKMLNLKIAFDGNKTRVTYRRTF